MDCTEAYRILRLAKEAASVFMEKAAFGDWGLPPGMRQQPATALSPAAGAMTARAATYPLRLTAYGAGSGLDTARNNANMMLRGAGAATGHMADAFRSVRRASRSIPSPPLAAVSPLVAAGKMDLDGKLLMPQLANRGLSRGFHTMADWVGEAPPRPFPAWNPGPGR